MKTRSTKIVRVIISLIIVIAATYLIWEIVSFSIVKITLASPNVFASIIGAIATISGAIAAVIITQYQTKKREIEEAHREKKVEIYKKFLEAIQGVIARENKNITIKGLSEQELVDYLFCHKTEILLWGSPKVIKAQLQFEATTRSHGDTLLLLTAMDNIYRAIREDIGLSNKGLNKFDLIKLYLNDPDELDKKLSQISEKI